MAIKKLQILELSESATIISGFTFREAINEDKSGDVLVLQAKNISNREYFTNSSKLLRIKLPTNPKESFLKERDVVLVSRGLSQLANDNQNKKNQNLKTAVFKATVFKDRATNVIASSSLFIIRVISQNITPEFLSAYLNSSTGQNSLAFISAGSNLHALLKNSLMKLEIPIPSLELQNQMVRLRENIFQQEIILEQKQQIFKRILNQSFKQVISV